MCGRFYIPEKELDDFARLVSEVEKHLLKKHGEIYPGDTVPIITPNNGEREVHAVKWGFPSHQGKKLIINARSETASEKPMFKAPFQKRRCLIPATGFYEWKANGNKKIKHFISIDNKLFYMAGLYWFFRDKNNENVIFPAFTILTTNANNKMQAVHDRMPVIIDESNIEKWLFSNDTGELKSMLCAVGSDKTYISEVS
ncbi:MAG TPA: SOS response-associated peptidase [Thermoclostridium sp.]